MVELIDKTVTGFEKYQELAHRTANTSLSDFLAIAVSGLGLSGEAGEVSDLIKKYIGHGHELDLVKLAKELGDVQWYIAEICTLTGLKLSDIAQMNVDKLAARFPEGFSVERSKNRSKDDV